MGLDPDSLPKELVERLEDSPFSASLRKRARALARPPSYQRLEREEQRIFARWLTLRALPHCWHATHKRSTATVGVFDFWVGVNTRSLWLEFKRQPELGLSHKQESFAQMLSAQHIPWHVVTNAAQAIAIVRALAPSQSTSQSI
jgi:hypothetical protein